MDIRVLRYFLATAREQNITRAAETLHIAQPSLSKQLMELEAELGKQLLIRGKRRITLTADGILLRKRAEEIVALLEKTEQEIASTDQDITGTVAIGGTPRQGVLEAASTLHQQYPQIRFSFHVGDAPDIIERLDHGSLDFIVLLDRPDKATYGSHPLPDVSLWGLLMKSDDPLTKKNSRHPKRPLPAPLGHCPTRRDSPNALRLGKARFRPIRHHRHLQRHERDPRPLCPLYSGTGPHHPRPPVADHRPGRRLSPPRSAHKNQSLPGLETLSCLFGSQSKILRNRLSTLSPKIACKRALPKRRICANHQIFLCEKDLWMSDSWRIPTTFPFVPKENSLLGEQDILSYLSTKKGVILSMSDSALYQRIDL